VPTNDSAAVGELIAIGLALTLVAFADAAHRGLMMARAAVHCLGRHGAPRQDTAAIHAFVLPVLEMV